VDGVDWGDALRDPKTGRRVRQACVMHLMEYREETEIASLRAAAAPGAPPRKYTVKKGDDLKKISTKMLGKSSRWPEIEKLNPGLRGWKIPDNMIGKTIKVPAK
jgi:LysM repeat protein